MEVETTGAPRSQHAAMVYMIPVDRHMPAPAQAILGLALQPYNSMDQAGHGLSGQNSIGRYFFLFDEAGKLRDRKTATMCFQYWVKLKIEVPVRIIIINPNTMLPSPANP